MFVLCPTKFLFSICLLMESMFKLLGIILYTDHCVTVLSSRHDWPGWVVTNKQCMPHCTSLLICPSLVAQWLEHLPRLQKVSGSIPGLGKNFSTFVTSVARKSSGQLARKMIVVRPCINAWQRPWRSPALVGKLLKSLRGPLYIHKQGSQPPLSLSA